MPGAGRGARVIGTLVAIALALQLVRNVLEPAATVSAGWNAATAILLVAAVALLWRPDPPWGVVFTLFLWASLQSAFATFGNDGFAATLAIAAAAAIGLYFAVAHVVFPIVFLRQGRWPATTPLPQVPAAGEPVPIPAFFAERAQAFAALGFAPRATIAQGDRNGRLDMVYFTHERDGLLAVAIRTAILARHVDATQFAVLPAEGATRRTSVIDATIPDPFPLPPDAPVLLFPGRSPAALLALLRQLDPAVPPLGAFADARALCDLVARRSEQRLAWLVAQGYLAPEPRDGEHRYTAKGAFVAAWRSLWPGSALVRANRRRIARAALRAAPPKPPAP